MATAMPALMLNLGSVFPLSVEQMFAMTYIPLHHKYRPQTFAELVGQEAIAQTLSHALEQQRIAPAYLFTGARGTGKTSSARILAKSLNCLASERPTTQPCGRCEVCRAIALGSALDVIEIDAASNTGVDNIRELIERAQFAPVQCRYKVYAIDECHMLSTAAFNALLKTLEEPPDRVVFVLATTDPQRVLPTIISRCQRFDFRRIPLDAMVQHLRQIADQEGITITHEALTLVGQLSQGGLRDAESTLDQLSLLAGEITVERVWELVGAVPERDLLNLLAAIAQDNPEILLDSLRRLMDRGREPVIVLQNLASFYRDLLIAKTAPQRGDLVALTAPTWQALCDLAQQWDVTTILAGQQHLRSSEVQLKNTTQPRLWLEVALMGLLPSALTNRRELASVQAPTSVATPLPHRSSQLLEPTKPAPAPVAVEPIAPPVVERSPTVAAPIVPAPVAKAAPLTTQDDTDLPSLETLWQEIVSQIQPFSTQVMVRQQCHLLSFDRQVAKIGVNSQPLYRMAQSKLPNIEAAFQQLFGEVRVSLEVIANPSTPAPVPATAPSPGLPAPPVQRHSATVVSPPATSAPSSPRASSIPPELLPPPNLEAPPQPGPTWQEDEVTQAAKQVAEFFGGKVVDLEDDEFHSPVLKSPEFEPSDPAVFSTDEDNDEDIPF